MAIRILWLMIQLDIPPPPHLPAAPAPSGEVSYRTSRQPSPTPSSLTRQTLWINRHWGGRIAPRPGFSSHPDMLSQNSRAIEIKKETLEDPKIPPRRPPGLSKEPDSDAEVFIPPVSTIDTKTTSNISTFTPLSIFPPSYAQFLFPALIFELFIILGVGTRKQKKSYFSRHMCGCITGTTPNFSYSLRAFAKISEVGCRGHHSPAVSLDLMESEFAFEGRVIRLMKRAEGFIHFRCPGLKRHIEAYVPAAPGRESTTGVSIYKAEDEIPPVINLSFFTNARPSVITDAAASALGGTLLSSENRDPDDLHLHPPIPSTSPNITGEFWVDSGFNAEQRVKCLTFSVLIHLSSFQFAALSVPTYQSPVLINGPPGEEINFGTLSDYNTFAQNCGRNRTLDLITNPAGGAYPQIRQRTLWPLDEEIHINEARTQELKSQCLELVDVDV
ncbi:hypothetical protein D9757_007537 [Collybiopsis confluens]|uniref:Uncharacterized protein n=1 Tax=Collybiopsis confluens TaxID=2823264 RepID=A0A8H5HF02_9AGAR|nr:hypothetical protein D9757_007537 [Collybiopsis confluens]